MTDLSIDNDTRVKKGSKEFNKIAMGLFLSGLSCFMQLYLFQPILPALTRQFKITPAESSFAVSFSTIGLALGLFVGALIADRISRKRLIGMALISSSVLTLLSAFVIHFPELVIINAVKGFLLSGSTSVAMTYVAEEVHPSVLGRATSLYITGNAVGGMSGRIASTLITGWLSWRWSAAILGIACLILGFLFVFRMPSSRHFRPSRVDVGKKIKEMKGYLRVPKLLSMYVLAALIMGTFVSLYNYLAFRLEGAPFGLPHQIIASVYLMYIVGSGGSMSSGILSDRFGSRRILMIMVSLSLIGLLLMLTSGLIPFIIGLGILTASFFGSHAAASKIVAEYSTKGRSTTISLYLLFYYIGSSFLGSGTGVIMHNHGWNSFILVLCAASLLAFMLSVGRHPSAESSKEATRGI